MNFFLDKIQTCLVVLEFSHKWNLSPWIIFDLNHYKEVMVYGLLVQLIKVLLYSHNGRNKWKISIFPLFAAVKRKNLYRLNMQEWKKFLVHRKRKTVSSWQFHRQVFIFSSWRHCRIVLWGWSSSWLVFLRCH